MNTKHSKTYTRIGLNILYYRKEAGMTQMELAERIDKSRNHVQKIETAAAVPSLPTLLDIAEALDIPLTKLLEER